MFRLYWNVGILAWTSFISLGNYLGSILAVPIDKLLFTVNCGKTAENYYLFKNNLVEENGTNITALDSHPFSNWSGAVRSNPKMTFVPKSKVGICNVVKYARKNGFKVRAGGYRHTFSELFPDADNFVFISMLDLRDAEIIPERNFSPDLTSDLVGIEVLEVINGGQNALVEAMQQ